MAKIETYFDCDLKKAVQVQPLNGNVFSLDNNGNRIGVRIFDNGVKTTVTGTVTGRAILADNSTVNLNGGLTTVNGQSVAYVDVPQGALLIPGTIKITIQLTASGVITTLAAILSTVYQTKTDNVITPSAQVIADWNATISSAIQTQNATIASAIATQDAQISDLKSAYNLLDNELNDSNNNVLLIENGTFSGSTGEIPQKVNNQYNRARVGSFIPSDRYDEIEIDDRYRIWIGELDEDCKIIANSSLTTWLTKVRRSQIQSSCKYLTVVVKSSTDSEMVLTGKELEITRAIKLTPNYYTKEETEKVIKGKNLIDGAVGIRDMLIEPFKNSTAQMFQSTSISENWDGEPRFSMAGSKYIRVDFPMLETGKQYTFSCDVTRCENGTNTAYIVIGSNEYGPFNAPSGSWNRISASFVADETTTFARVCINSTNTSATLNYVGSARKFCLNVGYNNEYMYSEQDEFVLQKMKILDIHTFPTEGQLNAIKRARQLTDIKWSTAKDLTRVSKQGNDSQSQDGKWFEDVFLKDSEYIGLPYSETNHMTDYGYARKAHIGETIGIETFITAARNPNSAVNTLSRYRQSEHSACLYGCVCSSVTSYALDFKNVATVFYPNISGMRSKGQLSTVGANTLNLCDLLLITNFHIGIITDIIRNDSNDVTFVEVSEGTPVGSGNNAKEGYKWGGVCRRKWYKASDLLDIWGPYIVYEYAYVSDTIYEANEYVPMLDEIVFNTNPNLPCMPYMGNKFIYKKGHIPETNILIASSGYNSLVVKKNGAAWNSNGTTNPYAVSEGAENVSVGFDDVGTYEAYLADIESGSEVNRTNPCRWRVSDATITVSVSNGIATFTCVLPDSFDRPTDAIISVNDNNQLKPWAHLEDEDITETDLSNGRKQYVFSITVDSSVASHGYYRVSFENEFGCWHSDEAYY